MSSGTMPDASERLNAHLSGYDRAMALRFVRATPEEIVAEYVVGDQHRQPYGIVHGGVHCGMVEATCSTGAGLAAVARGQGGVVGIENHTSFVHAARAGRIRVRATPLTRGRLSQLWEAVCTDDDGRVVAKGQVRLLCLEPGADLAGKPVPMRRGHENPLLAAGKS